MGSVVEYKCGKCQFSSGRLEIGWGKAGRSRYWGGLARCGGCREISVIDLNGGSYRQDRRCGRCDGSLALIEGVSANIACPACGIPMPHATLGLWS